MPPPESSPSFFAKGGGWVLAQFAIMAGWLVLTPLGHSVARSAALLIPAVALLAVGAVLGIAGMLVLGRNRTPFPRPRGDSRVVRSGVYAFVRHPLYASLIALGFGWALLWASGVGALLAVLQVVLLDAKARREERWLRAQFPEYAAYEATVRRFIPGIY